MRITLSEIARIAGVSKATVSRVIHNAPEGVGEETRERVKRVLEKYNYRSDEISIQQPNMRSHSIGLIIPDIRNPFFSEIASEISREAMRRDYVVLLGNTGFSMEMEESLVTAFVAKRVDGMILVSVGSECRDGHRMLEKYRVPCLLVDRVVEGMKSDAIIISDNIQASYMCCEMLINNGSYDVAYIAGPTDTSTSRERLEGYKKALRRFGIPYSKERIKQGNYTMEGGYEAVLEMERSGTRYSAVLAANDLMALGAMKALKELGYSIPDDVQVIGFDNIVYSQYTEPSLTTVQQPTLEMGRLAVQTIVDIIEGKKNYPKVTRLRPKLLKRKTTR